MSINIEVRKKQLQSLNQYITSSKEKVESILGYLGWTAKKVKEKKDEIRCPLNAGHKISTEKVDKHLETCSLRTVGYDPEETFLSEPLENASTSITLDNNKKITILNAARSSNVKFRQAWNGVDPDPMTSDRLMSTFSPDERLTLYDYCVGNTQAPPTPSEFNVNIDELGQKKDKQLTEEELREQERNAKRRRTKYKSVHTGRNKSHTEVMRQVIDNQMDLYRDYLAEQKRLEETYEQFDQPDASNIIYDFDADPSSVGSNLENLHNNTNYNLDDVEFGNEMQREASERRSNHSCDTSLQAQKDRRRQRERERDKIPRKRSRSRPRKGSYDERRPKGGSRNGGRRGGRYRSERRY